MFPSASLFVLSGRRGQYLYRYRPTRRSHLFVLRIEVSRRRVLSSKVHRRNVFLRPCLIPTCSIAYTPRGHRFRPSSLDPAAQLAEGGIYHKGESERRDKAQARNTRIKQSREDREGFCIVFLHSCNKQGFANKQNQKPCKPREQEESI